MEDFRKYFPQPKPAPLSNLARYERAMQTNGEAPL